MYGTTKYSNWPKFDRVTYWENRNYSGELLAEMRVSYDENGNATAYLYSQGENKHRSGQPVYVQIKNVYDKRKLLMSRFYYTNRTAGETQELTKIERFIYDKEPLIYRYQSGDVNLSRN